MIKLVAPNPSPMTLSGTNSYVLGDGKVAVIDPGPLIPRHLEAILEASAKQGKLDLILLTHRHGDHAGGARWLQEKSGAIVEPAVITDNQVFRLGALALRVLFTPGHSGDHVCFFQEDEKAIFTGDIVLGQGSTTIHPPDGNLADYIRSLKRLKELDAKEIFPGHGPSPCSPDRIEEMIRHRQKRHRQVLSCLEKNIHAPQEIVREIYPGIVPELFPFALQNVEAHLAAIQSGATIL